MRKYDVLSAGLMVMDIVVTNVDASVFSRDTSEVGSLAFSTGGDALNVATNLRKLGAGVALAGQIGHDSAGAGILSHLDRHGIPRELVQVTEDEATSTCVVLCTPQGERHFLYYPGANRFFDGELLTDGVLRQAGILYIGSFSGLPALENQRLLSLLRRAKKNGLMTVMDACGCAYSGESLRLLDEALPHVDVFFPSEEEAARICGENDPRKAALYFRGRGVGIAGVKLGEKGCYLSDRDGASHYPAIPCEKVVDTTGAGDAFMAGFIRGLTLGKTSAQCARMGAAMGYSCIRSVGATTHGCSLETVYQIMGGADTPGAPV